MGRSSKHQVVSVGEKCLKKVSRQEFSTRIGNFIGGMG